MTGTDEHHPNCYQRTGVPADLPAGLCDCRVLRMLDTPAEPDAGDAIEGLSVAARLELAAVFAGRSTMPHGLIEAVERVVAATADRARREGAVEALREAATAFGHMWQADPIPSASVVYAALRARADRLETP